MRLWQEWRAQYRHYNGNIRYFFLMYLLTQIGMGMFMVIYNFYIRELGYSEQMNGSVISISALASAIILIPAGMLSDKMSRKKLMVWSVTGTSLFLFARTIFSTDEPLLAFAFLTGIMSAFLQVSAVPWLAENSDNKQRVHLFSFHFALMTASGVIGNLLGGMLTDFLHHVAGVSQLWSIRLTLMIAVGFYMAGILPLFKMKEMKREGHTRKTDFDFVGFLKHNRSMLWVIALFTVAQLFIGFGSGLVIPYLNLYFADRFDASNTAIGLLLSLGQAVTAFAMLIGPQMVRRFGEVKSVVLLQTLSIPFLLLTAYTNVFFLATIGFLFRHALMNAANPIIMSIMMERVDDRLKGLANSLNQMVFQLGWALMGPVSTAIVVKSGAYWGYAYVFTITGSLYLISSLFFYMMFRQKVVRVKVNETHKSTV